jgi:predicted nucleic acid-binding protein
MYTIDANVFARTLAANQPDHHTYHMLLDRLGTARVPIIVQLIVLVEIAGSVCRTIGDPNRR